MAVTVRGEQLGLLARMRRARLRHRRGSKAGRYYRARRRSPKLLNFEELQQPTTCSSSKHFSVAEVRGQLARPAKRGRTDDHRIGAVQREDRDTFRSDSIEMIL